MSDTVRLRATLTWEYDANPRYYGTSDPAEMAQVDEEVIGEDSVLYMNASEPVTVTVEVV